MTWFWHGVVVKMDSLVTEMQTTEVNLRQSTPFWERALPVCTVEQSTLWPSLHVKSKPTVGAGMSGS